jgi:bacteriorhodopsin
MSVVQNKQVKQDNQETLIPKDTFTSSFTLTYILLITTGTITLIEALRAKDPLIRHIFNLETVISIIAGYFYSSFVDKIKTTPLDKINWADLSKTRYIDWTITTPIMLVVLMIALGQHINMKPSLLTYGIVLLLNYVMLYCGYAGEKGIISRTTGLYAGFVAFFIMFYIIFHQLVQPNYVLFNVVLFSFFFIVWSMYGIVYKLDNRRKNIALNILDLISKCFVGIGLWVYFTGIFDV